MPNRRASGLSGGCESSDHEKLSGNLHAQPQTKGVAPLVQRRVKGGGYSGHGGKEFVPYFQQGYSGRGYVVAGREYPQEHGTSQPHAGATLQHYGSSPTEYVNQGIEHQRLGAPNLTGDASRCLVEDFFAELPDKDLQYSVLVTPEVASQSVDSTVMSQCISLYRNASPTLVETQSASEGFAAANIGRDTKRFLDVSDQRGRWRMTSQVLAETDTFLVVIFLKHVLKQHEEQKDGVEREKGTINGIEEANEANDKEIEDADNIGEEDKEVEDEKNIGKEQKENNNDIIKIWEVILTVK
ncbi:hypothetical protein GIB67_030961 [Kingdonia uniflora]|uniref:Uncharacterized protein n=1 Tax=Kingdonia uniflora TaxID=39325 RepID=A0A7J7L3N1_9MAGN|nr:hypothetical protein GIB67_030961 [Kingdonia uniflora]